MAAAVSAAISLPSSKSSSLPERIGFNKAPLYYRNAVWTGGAKVLRIRAQITTEAPAKAEKISKKQEEGVVVNKFRPKDPYTGMCLLNTKITGDDAPGETWHMVFSTEGEVPYREGQSIGVIPDGIDKNGKPHKLRLYTIASSALGDFGDSKTFNGLAWLFLGVPAGSSLLYKEEFEKMKKKTPENFRLDFAVSREQTNDKGEKMYIQTQMAEYAEKLWEMLKKDNTFVYMCGLKGMEKGIDDIMVSLAAKDDYKKQLKKAEQWNVEVY